jgi:hypothetical protein
MELRLFVLMCRKKKIDVRRIYLSQACTQQLIPSRTKLVACSLSGLSSQCKQLINRKRLIRKSNKAGTKKFAFAQTK